MGVPSYFRWLSQKYRDVVIDVVEEEWAVVDGVKQPPDASLPNPNGMEYDNLYLDMNGIIHPCSHPENKPQPSSYEDIILNIFEYVERIFCIIRPRRLVFFAIDGVAPRAKMNQQRSRRFRAVKERREKAQIEEKLGDLRGSSNLDIVAKCDEAVGEDGSSWSFDPNCITPGTEFMEMISEALRLFICDHITRLESWRNIEVIFSSSSVPGEGEHKIMDFIRCQRDQPHYNPNLRHVLYGLDADLIMLGLATHEPHFTLLRETVTFNRPNEMAVQENPLVEKQVPFQFLRVYTFREYLQVDLYVQGLKFEWNFERVIDDYVFLCFFVGNDFLPHMPCLEIREGAIDLLMQLYKRLLPTFDGYLTENGNIDLGRAGDLLVQIGLLEDTILQRRLHREQRILNAEKMKKRRLSEISNDSPQMNANGSNTVLLDKKKGYASSSYFYGTREENKKSAQEMKAFVQASRSKASTPLDNAFSALESQLNRDFIQNGTKKVTSTVSGDQYVADDPRILVVCDDELVIANDPRLAKVAKISETESIPITVVEDDGSRGEITQSTNAAASMDDGNVPDMTEGVTNVKSENILTEGVTNVKSDIILTEGVTNVKSDIILTEDVANVESDSILTEGVATVEPESILAEDVATVEPESISALDDGEVSSVSNLLSPPSSKVIEQSRDEKSPEETLPLKIPDLPRSGGVEGDGAKVSDLNVLFSMNEQGWRNRYYQVKFGHGVDDTEFMRHLTHSYIMGLVWVLKYYYQGCCSWNWYYPYHYAPFAKELTNLTQLPPIVFERGEAVKPFEQLMSVLPAASKSCLPKIYHWYMTANESPLIDFYPEDFEIDLNGKRQAWQGVALLNFIDHQKLITTLSPLEAKLTARELKRNSFGNNLLFVHVDHPLAVMIHDCISKFSSDIEAVKVGQSETWMAQMNLDKSGNIRLSLESIGAQVQLYGFIGPWLDAPPIGSVIESSLVTGLSPVLDNKAVASCYFFPEYDSDHVFVSGLLPNAQLLQTLMPRDIEFRRRSQPRFGRVLDILEYAQNGLFRRINEPYQQHGVNVNSNSTDRQYNNATHDHTRYNRVDHRHQLERQGSLPSGGSFSTSHRYHRYDDDSWSGSRGGEMSIVGNPLVNAPAPSGGHSKSLGRGRRTNASNTNVNTYYHHPHHPYQMPPLPATNVMPTPQNPNNNNNTNYRYPPPNRAPYDNNRRHSIPMGGYMNNDTYNSSTNFNNYPITPYGQTHNRYQNTPPLYYQVPQPLTPQYDSYLPPRNPNYHRDPQYNNIVNDDPRLRYHHTQNNPIPPNTLPPYGHYQSYPPSTHYNYPHHHPPHQQRSQRPQPHQNLAPRNYHLPPPPPSTGPDNL